MKTTNNINYNHITYKVIQDRYYYGSVVKVALIYFNSMYTGLQLHKHTESGLYCIMRKIDNTTNTIYKEVDQVFYTKDQVAKRISELLA